MGLMSDVNNGHGGSSAQMQNSFVWGSEKNESKTQNQRGLKNEVCNFIKKFRESKSKPRSRRLPMSLNSVTWDAFHV